jgi:hypothetical protein
MKISIVSNTPSVIAAMRKASSQVPYALSVAINAAAEKARLAVRAEMQSVFNQPTPWVLNSLRVKRSTKSDLTAELAFKDKNSVESSRSMIAPHVFGGSRHFKAMEARLFGMGLLPSGFNAVPGAAASIDANGNMSRGQVSQLLNVLGTYTEAGYNKANAATSARLAKGNAKKNVYGFAYFVNPVNGAGRNKHLKPGVYQRVSTGFGSSLKPILIFVKRANYKQRLDFFGIAQTTIDREFPPEFNRAFNEAVRTALVPAQGGAR